MKKIIIPGGSGFLGTYLAKAAIKKGYQPIILSRSAKPQKEGIEYLQWDGKIMGDWAKALDGAAAVINMAGRTVDCRYTDENKRQILESRVDSTKILGEAIQACTTPPPVWLNSSSATIYEDTRGDTPANTEESTRIGDDFSMNVCKSWEKTFFEAPTPNVRRVALRTTIVFGRGGGAMEPLVGLVKWWLGGTQGSGKQFVSWLHIDDFVNICFFLIDNPKIEGIINAAAPNPITNKEFMAALRQAYGRSWGMPMMEWQLRLGAILIRTEAELILKSRKVVSKRLPEAGFQFQFEHILDAFKDILQSNA